MNATQENKITPEQALKVLTDVAALPTLKLSLQEHSVIQQSLEVLRPLVKPQELTADAKNPTV